MELKVRNVSVAQFIGDNYQTATVNNEKNTLIWVYRQCGTAHLKMESRHTIKWMTLYRASVNFFRMRFSRFAISGPHCCKTKVLITSCVAEKKTATNPWNNSLECELIGCFDIAFNRSRSSISSNKIRCVITCNRVYEIYEKNNRWTVVMCVLCSHIPHWLSELSTRTIEIVFQVRCLSLQIEACL